MEIVWLRLISKIDDRMKTMHQTRNSIIITGLLFIKLSSAFGQIEGVILDQKKIAVFNAIVVATDSATPKKDTVKSDKRGGYSFKGLKPGKYNVEAKAIGFQTMIYKNIIITTPPPGTDEGDDTYWAIRLDIILTPIKDQKQ